MEKANTEAIFDGSPGINLENPSFSKDSVRNSRENQKLLDKNSSSDDIMGSITSANEKHDIYIDSLNGQQQKGKQANNKFYIQQTLPKDFS